MFARELFPEEIDSKGREDTDDSEKWSDNLIRRESDETQDTDEDGKKWLMVGISRRVGECEVRESR